MSSTRFAKLFCVLSSVLGACSPDWEDDVPKDSGAAVHDKRDGSVSSPTADIAEDAMVGPSGPVINRPKADAGAGSGANGAAGPAHDADVEDTHEMPPTVTPPAVTAPPVTTPPVTAPPVTAPPVTNPSTPSMAELCKVCDSHAACTVTGGQAVCKCQDKYVGDGKSCKFDSNCSTLSCDANSTCTAIESTGTLSCDCKKGFIRGANSTACEDVDECGAITGNPCASKVDTPTCANTNGSYQCTCTPKAQAKNIIVNGDFPLLLDPWVSRLGNNTAKWYFGSASVAVPAAGMGGGAVYNDLLQNVPVLAGSTYRLSAQVTSSTNNGGDPCSFGARIAGSPANFGYAEFPAGSTNLQVQTTCTVPAGTSNVQVFIGCWNSKDGTLEEDFKVDNVSFVQTSGPGLCPN